MNIKLIQGHVLEALKKIEDNSIDTIITSPPYYSLRKYPEEANVVWDGDPNCKHEWDIKEREHPTRGKRDGKGYFDPKYLKKGKSFSSVVSSFCSKCGAWFGQLGLEPDLSMYIEHLFQIMKELKRVLKPTGVIFWNHGDCYGGSPSGNKPENVNKWGGKGDGLYKRIGLRHREGRIENKPTPKPQSIKPKCLALQNYRFIIRVLDELDLYLRNIICWVKPNSLPSSVKDRLTNKYEPVFFLTKSKRYFFNLSAIRRPLKSISGRFNYQVREAKKGRFGKIGVKASKEEGKLIDIFRYWGVDKNGNYNPKTTKDDLTNIHQTPAEIKQNILKSFKDKLVKKSTSEIALEHGYDPEALCPVCGRKWKRHAVRSKDRQSNLRREFIPCLTKHDFDWDKIKNDKESQLTLGGFSRFYSWQKKVGRIKHDDLAVGKVGNFSYSDPLHTKEYHPLGANPGDVISTRTIKENYKYKTRDPERHVNLLGGNPGDVLTLPTQPFSGLHFATFPESLVRFFIRAGCPENGLVLDPFCIHPDTEVITSDGMKYAYEVQPGDYVLTHKGVFRKVIKKIERNYNGFLIHIFSHGRSLLLTPNHPVLCSKAPKATRIKNYEWVEAGKLESGDFIVFPKYKEEYSVNLSKELLELIGWYLAEGHSTRYAVYFYGENNFPHLIKLLNSLKIPYSIQTKRIMISSVKLARFFNQFGCNAHVKRIPLWLKGAIPEEIKAVLKGMFLGDAHINTENKKYKGIYYSTVSPSLAWDLVCLSTKVGLFPRFHNFRANRIVKLPNGKLIVTKHKSYLLVYQGEQLENAPISISKGRNNFWKFKDGLIFSRCKVDKVAYRGKVINFFVEEDNSYVADGFIVHNCGSGTTIKVAIEEKRNAIGIDIVKDYIDMTIARCSLRNNPFINFEYVKI